MPITKSPALTAFLDLVAKDQLEKTKRAELLSERAAYATGAQYDDRPFDVDGYSKQHPGVYGYERRTPPWKQRALEAVWDLRGEVVREITDWTLSGDSWCRLEVKDDPDAEDWLTTVATATNMQDVIANARNFGGGIGVAIVSFALRNGEYVLEAHDPCTMWPIAWRDETTHRLAAVAKIYRGENALAVKDEDYPTLCRYWDETVEAFFVLQKDERTGDRYWAETASVAHNLGFCPVYWHPNGGGAEHDGCVDGEGCEGEIDEANELYAAAGTTTKRNADDTLLVHPLPGHENQSTFRKGGFNVIKAESAEYLSQDGDSARICVEIAEKRAHHVYRRSGVTMIEPGDLGQATSAEMHKRLFHRTLNTADEKRREYAKGLIVPLCQGILDAARKVGPKAIRIAPRVEEMLDETGGKIAKVITPRTPGKSNFVSCLWPLHFQPTADDLQKQVQAASTATGGKAIMSQRTAVAWLQSTPIPITNADEELAAIKADGAEAAELAAKAMGDPGPGASGDPDAKDDGDSTGPEKETEAA